MQSLRTTKTKIKKTQVGFTYLKCHGKMSKMCVQKPKATVPSQQQLYNGKGCAVKVDKIVKSLRNCTHKTMVTQPTYHQSKSF